MSYDPDWTFFLVPTEEITAAPRPPEDKLSEGELAGIIVTALAVAVISAVVIAVFLRNRRNSNDKKYGYVIQKLGSENWLIWSDCHFLV